MVITYLMLNCREDTEAKANLGQGQIVLERESSHHYMALSVHQLTEAGRGGLCIGVRLHTICTFEGEGTVSLSPPESNQCRYT